ncbi:MAG: hypothetical protein KBE41_03970 [Lutibacter sp.]|nr:hypothetical protein [Lutibacter sp.]MBP9600639.1 hypothetical protein [Lutibacter sp.]
MSDYKSQPFFKIAIRFAVGMLVIVAVLEIGFSIIKNWGFTGMVQQLFADGKWQYFVKRLSAMAAFYGLFMAGYYKFIKK